jgi:hypothetical protein
MAEEQNAIYNQAPKQKKKKKQMTFMPEPQKLVPVQAKPSKPLSQ